MQFVETEQKLYSFRVAWPFNPKMYHYGRKKLSVYQYVEVCQEKISIYWGIK